MNFYLVTAIVVAVLVAFSVLRAPVDGQARRFPWFWVAFPITVFSAASLMSMAVAVALLPDLGWTVYQVRAEMPGWQFLSSEQLAQMTACLPQSGFHWVVAIAGVLIGAFCSVWAWRRGRI